LPREDIVIRITIQATIQEINPGPEVIKRNTQMIRGTRLHHIPIRITGITSQVIEEMNTVMVTK
jgi:hypothetical protein